MPVPDYQTLMLPLLSRLAVEKTPVPVRTFIDSVADQFKLSPEERAERIPSGGENLLLNRLAWARTYLGKAGLVEAPKRGYVTITDAGRELLSRRPKKIDLALLREYPSFVEWAYGTQSRSTDSDAKNISGAQPLTSEAASNLTPRERIDAARQELDAALRSDLLARIREMTPSDFEFLVIRLLLAMGYGEGREELAKALGGSGDGGIDGVIHQDPLGLERVYVQAKRWKENNNVSSGEIRDFLGALHIKHSTKGVFVTASEFTRDAKSAAQAATVQVVLIDGARLTELMVRYTVGVLVRDTVEIKDIDDGFFEDA